MKLRKNQLKAIDISIKNNFKSGVHFHATGTGKSVIGLEIILNYNLKYPKHNILWLCEQKSILIEQFRKSKIREKGYDKIFNKFLIIDYTIKKPKKWFDNVNSATFWGKPILLIINRSFLVSGLKYKNLKLNIGLIIHDECHSISNNTTKKFYNFILNKKSKVKCIGFSATPNLDFNPFDNILSNYTIYDAYCDKVIVPPKINWIKSEHKLDNNDIIMISKKLIDKLPFKKIIIWCGMIDHCYDLADLWKKYFSDYLIAIDTSKNSKEINKELNEYFECDSKAILFCASKHREGSDIKNLDCCIFLDGVINRNSKTFIQCLGRVLRKDKLNKKKYGLIIDFKASNCLKVCDRVNSYLKCEDRFPWKYKYFGKKINKKNIIIHELLLTNKNKTNSYVDIKYNTDNLIDKFIIKCPDKDIYQKRLKKELKLIKEKDLIKYLIRAVEILEITKYIPHVTRGSCGSSLVCYLLGISNVDPIITNIKFERFLNQFRDSLPDIDFDFPHYFRDEVFLNLELKWPNQVARISNHVYWHERSALREAIRKIGIKKQIPKGELNKFLKNLSEDKRKLVLKYKKELEDTFRHYSLHCGGIIFFHDGIPDNIKLNKDKEKTISQIIFNKDHISKNKNFKIDILSSRGISQLIDICGKKIDFTNCPYDKKTYQLLQRGDNIGLTLAESPLMRKAMLKIKPKSIDDIAKCLAIIRPAAKDARINYNEIDYDTPFIYDDDAISILSENLKIPFDLADKFRKFISKNKWTKENKKLYNELREKIPIEKIEEIDRKLSNLRKYSFCKSHSYSYAQLVYKLAYQKAHHPKKFWKATLKNVQSSYRKWVHLYQARLAGVDVVSYLKENKNLSIYAENKRKKINLLSKKDQLKKYGYWIMDNYDFFRSCYFYKKNNEYYYSGIIASLKIYNFGKDYKVICYICVGNNNFIEIITTQRYYKKNIIGVKGRAILVNNIEKSFNSHITVFY